MASAVFRVLLVLLVTVAAAVALYFHYLRSPLGCSDKRVVDTARRIIKERLVNGDATDVILHLITNVSTTRDGVRCTAAAQIKKGPGKDDDYKDIEYMAFTGDNYYSEPSDKRSITVFASFKK